MSEPIDLGALEAWLERDAALLEAVVIRRLGEAPRPLPGRGVLTLEAWAWPVGLAAALVCLLAGAAASLPGAAPAPDSLRSLVARVAEGDPPRAADVYVLAGRGGGG